ncbi:MAG: YicC family protein [Cyclobacteriaceae bacterium]|nr:YicC family protein [Cyclobacteriaceae bacterium]
MVQSMTGFGNETVITENGKVIIEIRSLNSKFADLQLRLPKSLFERESEIRNTLTKELIRGKISVSIELLREKVENPRQSFNKELFQYYYNELKSLDDSVAGNSNDLFKLALQSPDVLISEPETYVSEEEWNVIDRALQVCIKKCKSFRMQEGKATEEKLAACNISIRESLTSIIEIEPRRTQLIKERLSKGIGALKEDENLDKNRLEQEIIFYIERLDINEEITRLSNHIEYFNEILMNTDANGKKLGFISQEMGREINTIGSKANNVEIQKHVVEMKDNLEQIKEQILNIV